VFRALPRGLLPVFYVMASFSAELHVAGHVFPVTHCLFDVTQATQLRGRVSAKVRYGPVQLVLDVSDGDVLLAWTADPHKRQATLVVFLNPTGASPFKRCAGRPPIARHHPRNGPFLEGTSFNLSFIQRNSQAFTIANYW